MANCYLCGAEITNENKTKEHIIPNALGGRLKSEGLICEECNSKYGSEIDAELIKQLEIYCALLNIKRDRGSPQPVKGEDEETGEEWVILPGGAPQIPDPEVIIEPEDGILTISIKARSEKEYRAILRGIKKKYPEIDIDEALKNPKWSQEWLTGPLHIRKSLGGEKAFRAVCKIITNFYIYKGFDPKYVNKGVSFIKEAKPVGVVTHFYPDSRVIKRKNEKEIGHCILIIGDNVGKTLYGFLELFDAFRFLVILDTEYDGPGISETYCLDVLKREETEIETQIPTIDDIKKTVGESKLPTERFTTAISNLLGKIDDKQNADLINQSIEEALNETLRRLEEGTEVTEEMINEFITALVKKLEPVIRRRFKE